MVFSYSVVLAFALFTVTGAASNVVISQVYGGGGNSGSTLKNDFIELFNRGVSAVDISGWSVQYASRTGDSWQVTELPKVQLQPGQYFLVQENSGSGGTVDLPTPGAMGTISMSSSAGKVVLASINTPVDSATTVNVLDLVGYGSSAFPFEGSGPTPGPSNTNAVFRNQNGCADTDDNAVDFTTGEAAPRNGASAFSPCSVQGALTIPEIQGSGATSPFVDTIVSTQGVVTLLTSNGFYMQDPKGDGNIATSDGIYVFTSTAPTVAIGDRVSLSGTVIEFVSGDASRPITELTSISSLTVLSQNMVVAATMISLPSTDTYYLERYEGMLVKFATVLTVGQNYFLGRFGQLTLAFGRLEKPTNRYAPGSAEATAATAANARNIILLDDNNFGQNPNPIPYIGANNTVRAGDTVSDLTGVIDFGSFTAFNGPSGYKLQPSIAPEFKRSNPRTRAPITTASNLKVASFNVLNFFTTFGDGNTADSETGQGCRQGSSVQASNCRGADNMNEFLRQRAKIVVAMTAIDADILGLMEIQNNGLVAVSNLVGALNAAVGAGTYAVVPEPAASGTDAIRNALIYKPSKVTLVGSSIADTDSVNSRPPFAQAFQFKAGSIFSVIVNHMKSKGSCPSSSADPNGDKGDGQGCFTALRSAQAQRLIDFFIPEVQKSSKSNNVMIIGDLNAYGREDPITVLTSNGLIDQINRLVRPTGIPYSYIFDGESGYIDHALTTSSMSSLVAGVTEWHINADEPFVIDYNTEFKPQDLYSRSAFRSSDHDPVIISLNLSSV